MQGCAASGAGMANTTKELTDAALDLLEARASEMAGAQGGRAEMAIYELEIKLAAARIRVVLRDTLDLRETATDGTRVPSESRPRRNNGKRSKGRKSRTEKGPRVCGECGESGHNARTCKAQAPAVES